MPVPISNNSKPKTSVFHDDRGRAQNTSSSIFHMGKQTARASTSVFHPGVQELAGPGGLTDEERDEARYNFIRQKIRERKAKEARGEYVEHPPGSQEGELGVGTGNDFRTTGKKSLAEKVKKLRRSNPKYKNLSDKEIMEFQKQVGSHAKNISSGKGFSSGAKDRIKQDIARAADRGVYSSQDADDLADLVGKL